jgi:hypothetical protein
MGWVEASLMVALYWADAGPIQRTTITTARHNTNAFFMFVPPFSSMRIINRLEPIQTQ